MQDLCAQPKTCLPMIQPIIEKARFPTQLTSDAEETIGRLSGLIVSRTPAEISVASEVASANVDVRLRVFTGDMVVIGEFES